MTKKVKIRVFCTNEKCTMCVLPLFCFSSTLLCRSVIESKTKERRMLEKDLRKEKTGIYKSSYISLLHTQPFFFLFVFITIKNASFIGKGYRKSPNYTSCFVYTKIPAPRRIKFGVMGRRFTLLSIFLTKYSQ